MNGINYWAIFDGRALLLVMLMLGTWTWYYLTK